MNQILKLSIFGVLLFAVGGMAGHMMLVDRTPPKLLMSDNASLSDGVRESSVFSNRHVHSEYSGDLQIQPASFEFVSADSDAEAAAEFRDSRAHDHQRAFAEPDIRAMIRKAFPNLTAEELEGWVETYCSVPPEDLELLLKEKQAMADMLPLSSGSSLFELSNSPTLTSTLSHSTLTRSETKQWISVLLQAERHLKANLLHAATPGFRRTEVRTTVATVSATADAHTPKLVTSFDFTPGSIRSSDNTLHLAIRQNPQHWFLLEPGNLLTRYGAFSRSPDGRLAIIADGVMHFLVSDVRIPNDAIDVNVSETGEFFFADGDGKQQSAGQLELARVSWPSRLASTNGVYFEFTDDDNEIAMTNEVSIDGSAIEESNVDSAMEFHQLHQFEQLSHMCELSSSLPPE